MDRSVPSAQSSFLSRPPYGIFRDENVKKVDGIRSVDEEPESSEDGDEIVFDMVLRGRYLKPLSKHLKLSGVAGPVF